MLTCLVWAALAGAATRAVSSAPPDAFYQALLGEPQAVDVDALLASPGQFVGHAVRTHGRLHRSDTGALELAAGARHARLRLEPEAAAMVAARGSSPSDATVEVVGFFYRESVDDSEGAYALRAWSVWPDGRPPKPSGEEATAALEVSLEQLVYGAGRYDDQLVRVRGSYRGANIHNDLPATTRAGSRDWVIKDGYFAVWVTGREARGDGWDLTRLRREETDTPIEVVGVPKFRGGVVRIEAREVRISAVSATATTSRGLGMTDSARDAAVAPRVAFAFPVDGDTLDTQGHMILQFSNAMDPTRFEAGVRIHYEQQGRMIGAPRVRLDYRDRYRVLVITPEAPPPPDAVVVVELRGMVLDVDGHGLAPRDAETRDGSPPADGVVDRVRFRSHP